MCEEVVNENHAEHYATYMPEQEYLTRFYGTFRQWTHIDPQFNYELDKETRVPHDWSDRHSALNEDGYPEVVVFHFSGMPIKPWGPVLGGRSYSDAKIVDPVMMPSTLEHMRRDLQWDEQNGPPPRLMGTAHPQRIWAAMLEWRAELISELENVQTEFPDIIACVKDRHCANHIRYRV